jgi:hypothetical protein
MNWKSAASLGILISCLISMWGSVFAASPQEKDAMTIVHEGFTTFIRGTLGDAGANSYVSARGNIETIHRGDLNRDGELDLVFTQDHNFNYAPDAMIYWGRLNGPESLQPLLPEYRSAYTLLKQAEHALKKITWLPSLGGGRCQIADLNNDGWLDIISGNMMHNFRHDMPAYIYWGSAEGFRESERTILPAYIASGIAVGDLNEDGLPDVILANQGYERGFDLRFGPMSGHEKSFIYWGHPTGFDTTSRLELPTLAAADVATGDFNGDGHLDLAFLNNLREEQSVYVYWGDGTGRFDVANRQVLRPGAETKGAAGVTLEFNTALSSDLNDDGNVDLVVAGNDGVVVYYGGRGGFNPAGASSLPAKNCHGLEAVDLNQDGHIDLVVTNAGVILDESDSVIYWGGVEGYSAERKSNLATIGAMSVKAADLNHDGFADLVFGNVNTTKDTPSQIFWGSASGYADDQQYALQSFGAMGVGIADFDRDGNQDVVLLNHLSGNGETSLPTSIYWGNQAHHYTTQNLTQLNPGGYMMYTIADLDDDGYPDIVLVEAGHPWIWWGSATGYAVDNRTELPIMSLPGGTGVLGLNVADFDRDGYLDIICSGRDASAGPHAIIVYGSEVHFKTARTESFALSGSAATVGSTTVTVADLNRDGFLDLIFPLQDVGNSQIRWGGAEGYAAGRITTLESNGGCQATVADLDRDGWLDIVFTSGVMGKAQPDQTTIGGTGIIGTTRNSRASIYWGNAKGEFHEAAYLEIFNSLDVTVADLNRDGHLDLAFSNYLSDTTRELPAFIYWGDGTRVYSESRRTLLDAASSAAIDALDLNQDGWLDLVITNHQKNFSHTSGTNIYWGGAEGYSIARRDNLPTIGSHLDAAVDAGNLYDRSYAWDYLSESIEAAKGMKFDRLRWQAETELGTAVKFQVRSAATSSALAAAVWSGPDGPGSYYVTTDTPLSEAPSSHRWLQYRAVLTAPNGGNSARLSEVEIVYRTL